MSCGAKSKVSVPSRTGSSPDDLDRFANCLAFSPGLPVTAPPIRSIPDNPLETLPMRPRQVLVLLTALLLAALDGFDALSMAFVGPVLSRDWHIGKDVLGLLLSSSLAGMAIGAVALAPFADKLGRRAVVLGAIAILTVGSGLSAAAGSVAVLAASRVLTGIGIGLMVAMTTLISAEFTNKSRRSLAIAGVATMGFPIGGILGGLASSAILKHATWPWVFLTLPESPVFLVVRRAPDALKAVNRVLRQLGHSRLIELPPVVDRANARYVALFSPQLRPAVLRLTAIAILIATSSYYILNWLPQLVVDAGFTPAQGSFVSALSGMIGFVGGIVFAAFASRYPPTNVAGVSMAGAALAFAAVGLVPPVIALIVASAGVLSFCLAGTTGLIYTILADTFPTGLRASGMGFVMGVMRIASAAGPTLAGVMFAHGMTRASVSLIFALGPLVAAWLTFTMHRHASPQGLDANL